MEENLPKNKKFFSFSKLFYIFWRIRVRRKEYPLPLKKNKLNQTKKKMLFLLDSSRVFTSVLFFFLSFLFFSFFFFFLIFAPSFENNSVFHSFYFFPIKFHSFIHLIISLCYFYFFFTLSFYPISQLKKFFWSEYYYIHHNFVINIISSISSHQLMSSTNYLEA